MAGHSVGRKVKKRLVFEGSHALSGSVHSSFLIWGQHPSTSDQVLTPDIGNSSLLSFLSCPAFMAMVPDCR